MELFSRFKRDYLNYLISIIIPVLINAVSIPIFKQLLGAEGYGAFTITFNSLLLFTAALTGWLTQSIIRFFPSSGNKKSFAKTVLRITMRLQLLVALPALLLVAFLKQDWILGLLYSCVLLVTSLQFTILALSQSAFLSSKSIYSEIIRTVSYLTLALLLLRAFPQYYMYDLFGALLISYLLSFLYLYRKTFSHLARTADDEAAPLQGHYLRQFFAYGAPLSLWFVFAYLISYTDKLFLFRQAGAGVQGDYQANFDLLSKSITAIISPVIVSLFPLLTAAWQHGDRLAARKLIRRIITLEAAGMCLALILYFLFGAQWLFQLTHVEDTAEHRISGAMIIAGTFLWQMAMVVHKRYELRMNTRFLLMMVMIAAAVQVLIYLLAGPAHPLLYPAGFLTASGLYLFLVSAGFRAGTYSFPEKREITTISH